MLDDQTLLRQLFHCAVSTADPAVTIPTSLPAKPAGRVLVVGAGKASARMAEIVERCWGPCAGLVITRYGYARPTQGIEVVEASHPVPDAAGIAATQQMLAMLADLGPDDFVLSLISGGASALLCAPSAGLTLRDKQAVHRALLRSGAPISAMNLVRKHLSASKAGQLAAASYPATMLSLMISDVPGDEMSQIGSGPTVGEVSTSAEALDCVQRYGIDLPAAALAVLRLPSRVIVPSDPRLSKVQNHLIAAPSQSLEAAQEMAQKRGIEVLILGDALEGEASDLAQSQVTLALERQRKMSAGDPPLLLLSGGECTVTRQDDRDGDGNRDDEGAAIGGPNAEFALAAALALQGATGISLLAGDTDGVDGAAEVAGAFIDAGTLQRARAAGISATKALENHNSHSFFAAIGDQVVTGPTLTNVNDFRALLIHPSQHK